MELDEFKDQWDNMSKEIDNQKLLTDKLIKEMTQEKYKSSIKSISIPETIGAVICFAAAIYILMKFKSLDTWYFVVCGVLAIGYLILMPIMSISSINKMKEINLAKNGVAITLEKFVNAKKKFWKVQRFGFYLNFVFIVVILPISGKLLRNKNLFLEEKLWYFYIPVMALFLIVISKLGLKHYKKSTQTAENLLKELDVN